MYKFIATILTTVLLVSCTPQEIVQEYNAWKNMFTKPDNEKYSIGSQFHNSGYNLKNVAPSEIKICQIGKFNETDSICYLRIQKYDMRDNEFYFMIMPQSEAEEILSYTLSKEILSKSIDRRKFLWDFFEYTDLKHIQSNDNWTYYKAKKIKVKGNEPGTLVRTGYHLELEPFSFNIARKAYLDQRNLDENGNPKPVPSIEEQMALNIFLHKLGLKAFFNSPGGRTYQEKLIYKAAGGY